MSDFHIRRGGWDHRPVEPVFVDLLQEELVFRAEPYTREAEAVEKPKDEFISNKRESWLWPGSVCDGTVFVGFEF